MAGRVCDEPRCRAMSVPGRRFGSRRMKAVNVRRILSCLLVVLGLFGVEGARAQVAVVGDGGPGPVKAPHLTAELVSLGPAIAPAGTQTVGLVLTMEDKWHVYWANAGDSGEPPHIKWTMPGGVTAG